MKTNYTIKFNGSAVMLFLIGLFTFTSTKAQTGGATFEVGPTMMRGKNIPYNFFIG